MTLLEDNMRFCLILICTGMSAIVIGKQRAQSPRKSMPSAEVLSKDFKGTETAFGLTIAQMEAHKKAHMADGTNCSSWQHLMAHSAQAAKKKAALLKSRNHWRILDSGAHGAHRKAHRKADLLDPRDFWRMQTDSRRQKVNLISKTPFLTTTSTTSNPTTTTVTTTTMSAPTSVSTSRQKRQLGQLAGRILAQSAPALLGLVSNLVKPEAKVSHRLKALQKHHKAIPQESCSKTDPTCVSYDSLKNSFEHTFLRTLLLRNKSLDHFLGCIKCC